jgi:NAD(P)-dependent dehydrogenase (short-subunit alcohol dehydrogenase family)
MAIRFDGKVAIVTGAGGGLGKCHALELAKRGAKVVVNDFGGSAAGTGSSASPAQQVVNEITTAGGEAIANTASVSDEQGAASIVQDAINKWGRVDILINNAGILRDKSFSKVTIEDFQAVINVHLWGTVFCTKAAWPHMLKQNYGRIIMTSSSSGLFGNFGQTNYSAAKMSVIGLMNSLKQEGAKYNVHVNAVAPVAATRLTEELMPEQMRKALSPHTVTPAVVYLCSDSAPTGIILQAAGGNFQRIAVMEGKGKNLGVDATVEDVARNFDAICNLDGARAKNSATE